MTALLEALPTVTRGRIKYPLVLPRHRAFHTPLMARMQLGLEAAPSVPPFAPPAYRQPFRSWTALVDSGLRATQRRSGRFVNTPSAKQVLTPYHFGRSVEAAIEALDLPWTQRFSCSSGQGAH
jgi:hypothetical protein